MRFFFGAGYPDPTQRFPVVFLAFLGGHGLIGAFRL
jgi:hypothetical protein